MKGELRRVVVEAAGTVPLVGRALLDGYTLRVECIERGRVEIERLS
jgi:hypothetical protein